VGVLQRFERRLGGLVEGAFAKVFKGGVEPVEIASALARETDDRRAISANRTLVPNEFAVELASGDYARLAPYKDALCDELAAMVSEHAAEQRYTFVGPVSIRLTEAPDLDVGVFRIRSSVAAADAGGFPNRGASGQPVRGASGRPRLVISTKPNPEGGGGAEREFVLDSEVALIGRSVECEIRLNDTGVSRRHAEIRQMPDGRHVFADLGSTNGSLVNGRPASQARLADGDRVEVGNTLMLYRNSEQRPPSRERRPAEPDAYRADPPDRYADGGGYPAEPGYGGRGYDGEPGYDDPQYSDPRYDAAPYRNEPPAAPAREPYGAPYRQDGFPERGPRPGGGRSARGYPDDGYPADSYPAEERGGAPSRHAEPHGGREYGVGEYDEDSDDDYPTGRRDDPYRAGGYPAQDVPRRPDPYQGAEPARSERGRVDDGYWEQPDRYAPSEPYEGRRGASQGRSGRGGEAGDGRRRAAEPREREHGDSPRHDFPDRTW
jgi:pSer/pThr/pTyr-binding forkhead associated (FHA) protein